MSRENEWIDPAEAGLRLILTTSGEPADDPDLAGALVAAPLAAIIAPPVALSAWRPLCQAAGCALLAANDVEAALASGVDGVHLARVEGVADARRRLGERRLLGVSAGESRHWAMVAGEAGADYVLLGPRAASVDHAKLLDLVRWWSELFVLPCAVGPVSDASVAELRGCGLDFLVAELSTVVRLRELVTIIRADAGPR